MLESLQMFLFLFKSKYRRKCSWFSPFLCSVLIVLLFCNNVLTVCNEQNCSNGVCLNGTCECFEGWQGPECQYCGGKIKLTEPTGVITDGPGNYSVSVQCSWLIAPPWIGPRPPPIRIRLENFATECGWDHLYVYDGDSVRASKLLAVFSGLIGEDESSWTRQVVATSGHALLHFFSDDAYAMEGFNVTYAAYSCPSNAHHTNCSNHGVCEDGTCRCDRGWAGVACDQIDCHEDCLSQSWSGSCSCASETGSARWSRGWGEAGEVGGRADVAPPTAGHVLLVYQDSLVSVAGETYMNTHILYKYKVSDKSWEPIESRNQPASRFAHSAVLYGHEVIMYGGVVAYDDPERSGGLAGLEGRGYDVTNEVWRAGLDAGRPHWRNVTPPCSATPSTPLTHCGCLHVSGHTAVLVTLGPLKKPVMLVFFGHSPHYGYLHVVQEYYVEENTWSIAATRGWTARGGFGHSAVWDPLSARVYLHGGLVSLSEAAQAPSSGLAEYDVENRIWKYLPSAPTPRYLHSATFISPGVMLVFGGNAHNDTAAAASNPASAKCFSGAPLLYDVRCQTWYRIEAPPGLARAAHAAAALPNQSVPTVLIHGGFDGRLRSDALLYVAGSSCSTVKTELDCVLHAHKTARACVWRYHDNTCVSLEEIGWLESFEDHVKACAVEPTLASDVCSMGDSCMSCTGLGCVWCGGCYASAAHCSVHRRQVATNVDECGSGWEAIREGCGRLHSCAACHAHRHNHHLVSTGSEDLGPRVCYWDYDTVKCKPANATDDIRSVSTVSGCPAPCATYETCANCTAEECIWCGSAARCVDKNAYAASFPLGGCRVWATSGAGHLCDHHAGCQLHHNCHQCRSEPACGWCEHPAGGGRGSCVAGGARGPHAPGSCDPDRWFFTSCPLCQCNGHSYCDGSGRCIQPCGGRTVGAHCEACAPGHWGTAANGAVCQQCECNAMAVACSADTGRCYCSVKGLTGDRCEKCDTANHYHGDPYNKGACYYDLAVDYQFTFNLSKKEDRHLSAINFRNTPMKADVDADFTIMCSSHARMNITVRKRHNMNETALLTNLNCTNFRHKFLKSEYSFGIEDNVTLTTFFVYVYDFKPPLWIQISFSQYPKLNLQQFFITFSSCFLLLLLVAAALWKIKQRYDMYRRRQRLFVEMEQMASRPFSSVCIELEKGGGGSGVPAPVALEPCAGGRAAVLSLVVRLPTGGTGRAPPLGGLAVASALVTLGHQPPTAKRPRNH